MDEEIPVGRTRQALLMATILPKACLGQAAQRTTSGALPISKITFGVPSITTTLSTGRNASRCRPVERLYSLNRPSKTPAGFRLASTKGSLPAGCKMWP
ncbi:hypothetical protein NKI41_21905 [Mesorhizobium sp. M0601]|uniref:hypothetical protein n=1 Tax=Mesorhizobium sp. M0601 TaxID=2956969 RepID=UPI00333A9448